MNFSQASSIQKGGNTSITADWDKTLMPAQPAFTADPFSLLDFFFLVGRMDYWPEALEGLIVLVSPTSRTEKAVIKLANTSWRKIYLGL